MLRSLDALTDVKRSIYFDVYGQKSSAVPASAVAVVVVAVVAAAVVAVIADESD